MNKLITLLLTLLVSSQMMAQCHIYDMTVEQLPCNENGKFAVVINFMHENTGDDGFKIQGNGNNYGTFSYSALPITIDGLTGNCETPFEFVAKDIAHPDCSDFVELGVVCCSNTNCNIQITGLEVGECNDGHFSVSFGLEHPGTQNNYFNVYTYDQNLGYFPFDDLPLTIENFPASGESIEQIVVCENDNNTCCDTIYFETPCTCSISGVQTRKVECSNDDSTYYLKVNFKHQLTSDSFQIGSGLDFYGTYSYSSLPIVIGPVPFSTDPTDFLIIDNDDFFCYKEFTIAPYTECNVACSITNVNATITDCVDGQFYAHITFDYNNPGVNGFKIRGNGVVYGTYLYGENEYVVGPLNGDCVTQYEFVVVDVDMENCKGQYNFNEPICCNTNCEISNLEAVGICNNDGRFIKLNFTHNQSNDAHFNVNVNGDLIGNYTFGDLPLTFPYEFVDGQIYQIVVFNETCEKGGEFSFQCNSQNCEIFDLVAEAHECNDDGNFLLDVAFQHNAGVSNSFKIIIHDMVFGPYEYGQTFYTVGPLPGNCTVNKVIVQDLENPACKDVFEFEHAICCNECNLAFGDIIPLCDGNVIYAIKVGANNNGSNTDSFNLRISGVNYGNFAYSQSPVIIDIPDQTSGTFSFRIQDTEIQNCVKELNKMLSCGNCEIYDLVAEAHACNDDGNFLLDVAFQHNAGVSNTFKILINDMVFGPYEYGQTFYTVGPLPGNCTVNKVIVQDLENPACKDVFEFEHAICCNECNLAFGDIIPLCDGNVIYAIKVGANNSGSNTDSFNLRISGVNYGNFAYSQSPVIIDIPDQTSGTFSFRIQDTEIQNCVKELNKVLSCGNCEIYDLVAEAHECNDDGNFLLDVAFQHNAGVSNSFKIIIHDMVFGPYEYGQTFYTVGPLPGNCTVNKVIVQDLENPACKDVFEFEHAICCNECNLAFGDIIPICDEGLVTAIKIGASNNGSNTDSFNLKISGVNYGNFAYSQSPVIIDIPDHESGFFSFRIQDTELTNCVKEVNKELICEDCVLRELQISYDDCTEQTFRFVVNFISEQTPSDSFVVWVKNDKYGPYAYGDQPITSQLYDKTATPYRVRVEDAVNESCALKRVLEHIVCETAVTDIEDWEINQLNLIGDYLNLVSPTHIENATITLYDINGRVLYKKNQNLEFGTNGILIGNQLAKVIIVRISTESKMQAYRLINIK